MNKSLKKMYKLANKTLGVNEEYTKDCSINNLINEMQNVIGKFSIKIENNKKEQYITICGQEWSLSYLKLIVIDKINELENALKLGSNTYLTITLSAIISIMVTVFISALPEDRYEVKILFGLFMSIIAWGVPFILDRCNMWFNDSQLTEIRYYKLLLGIIEKYKEE